MLPEVSYYFMLSACSHKTLPINSIMLAPIIPIKIFLALQRKRVNLCFEWASFSSDEQNPHVRINKFLGFGSKEIAVQKADVYVGFFQIKFPRAEPILAPDQRH